MLKGQKGITLVALVITIIVLLILAGVTIALTLGDNGLLQRTQEAKNAHQAGANNDTNFMDQAYDYMTPYFNQTNNTNGTNEPTGE